MEAGREIETHLQHWQENLPPEAMASQRQALIALINQLLLTDFGKLVQVLYRIDVAEQKLKTLLQEQPTTDAAELIADLLIERQMQKQKFRQSLSSNTPDNDEEKW